MCVSKKAKVGVGLSEMNEAKVAQAFLVHPFLSAAAAYFGDCFVILFFLLLLILVNLGDDPFYCCCLFW